MYKFLVNNGQGLAFGLGLVVVVLFLFNVISGLDEFTALPEEDQASTTIFNFGLYGTLVLFLIAAAGMVLFGLYHIAVNFRGSLKGILGVVVLAVIFIVAYNMAPGEPEITAIEEATQKAGGISEGQLKFIGGAISTVLVLLAVAAASFVFSEIRNFFK